MRKKSNKLRKKEKNRFSIFTNDFRRCFYCGRYGGIDKHEVYGGANRQASMKYGLVVPLCRNCHETNVVIEDLKVYCQKQFERSHSREDFMKIIGKNYIK